MNKHFDINDADHESDWKDLTIIRLLGEVSDLEEIIDKAIEYIEHAHFMNINYKDGLLKILKGSEEDEKD